MAEIDLSIQQLPAQSCEISVMQCLAVSAAFFLCALHSSSSAQNHDINSKSLENVGFITRGLSD